MGKRKFIVRWTIDHKRSGWVQAKAGEEVELIRQVDTIEWGHKTPMVKTTETQQTGRIPPHFLKGYIVDHDNNDTTESTANTNSHAVKETDGVKWFVGDLGPLQAANYLTNPQLNTGTFIVCQPPEFYFKGKHPELLLLIRIYSGSDEKWKREWEQQNERRKAGTVGVETIAVKCDPLPGCRAPLPQIAYVRILRDQDTGTYYIFKEDDHFITVHDLIGAYIKHGRGIHLGVGFDVVLQSPPLTIPKSEGPRPPFFREPAQKHKETESGTVNALPLDTTIKLGGGTTTEGHFGRTTIGSLTYSDGKKKKKELKIAMKMIPVDPHEYQEYFRALSTKCNDGIHSNYIHKWRFIANGATIHKRQQKTKDQPCRTGMCSNFAELGSLVEHLKNRAKTNKLLLLRQLLEILYQVASGMAYLEDLQLCHLALGARNILVTAVTQQAVHVAISDFYLPGLRLLKSDVFIRERKQMDRQAWRWMALETLRGGAFGIETDVWSYGVLAFEVLTHCTQSPPYGTRIGCSLALLEFLQKGQRMMLPNTIPAYMQSVMQDCWGEEPKQRPSFYQLMTLLANLLFDSVIGPSRAIWQYEQRRVRLSRKPQIVRSVSSSTTHTLRNKGKSAYPTVDSRRPMRPESCQKKKT